MTIREAAKLLGVSYQRVQFLRNNGTLEATDTGITEESVMQYRNTKRKPGRPVGTFKNK